MNDLQEDEDFACLDVKNMFEVAELYRAIEEGIIDPEKKKEVIKWLDILVKCANRGINKE